MRTLKTGVFLHFYLWKPDFCPPVGFPVVSATLFLHLRRFVRDIQRAGQ